MKLRVLFYRAERDGHWLDDGISLWTKLFNWKTKPYSHCEIWWPDADGRFVSEIDPSVHLGVCFTSTMRGTANGTVVRKAYTVLTHPSRWDYCEIEVPDDMAWEAINWACFAAANNQGYDKLQILGFFFPWRFGSADQNICSEAVGKFLYRSGVLNSQKVLSPRRLSRQLETMGYRAKALK